MNNYDHGFPDRPANIPDGSDNPLNNPLEDLDKTGFDPSQIPGVESARGFSDANPGFGVLFHLSNLLRQGETVSEKAPTLVEHLKSMTGASLGALALLDGEKLRFEYGAGNHVDDLGGLQFAYSYDPLWQALWSGQIQLSLTPPLDAPEDQGKLFSLITRGLAAYVVIPLVTPLSVIGLLFLGFNEPSPSLETMAPVFSAISNMAGNAFNQVLTTTKLEEIVSEQSQYLNTLYQIIALINQAQDSTQAFRIALKEIIKSAGFSMGGVFLVNENAAELDLAAEINVPLSLQGLLQHLPLDVSLVGQVVRSGERLIDADITEEMFEGNLHNLILPLTYHGLPMRSQGKVIGVVSLVGIPERNLSIDQISFLASVADHLAMTVENHRLRRNAERAAVVEERNRLAREFHDSVVQSLYSATLLTAASQDLLNAGKLEGLQDNLERLNIITRMALKELRLLVYELHSPALDEGGVVEAVRRRISAVELRAGVDAQFEAQNYHPMNIREEEELYWIALEGLNNTLKHANATRVKVAFDLVDNFIILKIEDNGVGFNLLDAPGKFGNGIRSMRERCEKLGGRLEIQSVIGEGTRLTAFVPYQDIDTITSSDFIC